MVRGYDRIGGYEQGDDGVDIAEIAATPLIELDRDEPGGTGRLRPAALPAAWQRVLEGMGAQRAAKSVRYGMFEHRRSQSDGWRWALDGAFKWMVGYGVYPFRLLAWFGGLVALGWLVAFAAPALSGYSPLKRFWYSLENALPLVSLSNDMADVEHRGFVMHFFHVQKILGFLFGTILVGALSLLGS